MKNDPWLNIDSYSGFAKQEADFWGNVQATPDNPQLWHEPYLFSVFLESTWNEFIEAICRSGHNVLELGCGEGNLSIELAKRGRCVTGMDISDQRIERAKTKAGAIFGSPERIPNFQVKDLNITELPQDTFDTVVAHDVLHHILNLEFVLDQVNNTLKPHGKLFVYDYIGIGKIRKLLLASLYGILPTYKPYREKLKLSAGLHNFLLSEKGKRKTLSHHPKLQSGKSYSPFEEISQGSIIREIERRFTVKSLHYYLPFFFYLAPKIRVPGSLKHSVAVLFHRLDEYLLQSHVCKGAYISLYAEKK